MKVIIIEDEPLMSNALREELVAVAPAIEVVAQLTSIKASIEYLNNNPFPDLFFADIELSDGVSFEIFKHFNNTVPIIFCTAYNQYALEAFQVYGIDYLLKPFDSEAIKAALDKFKSLANFQATITPDLQTITQLLTGIHQEQKHSILVHQGDKIIPFSTEQIALAQLENGVVYIIDFDGKRQAVNHNMDKLSHLLGSRFYRVNRQFIISRKAIKHASQYFARKILIQPKFDFQAPLIVSKAKASDFLRWLENS
ncbi:MAG: LytTR family DNA-binding domain-containing protein [Bacteroidota bacterium]